MEHWNKEFNYHNACTEPCDTFIGHCCCGAYHTEGEFLIEGGNLYRYDKWVAKERGYKIKLSDKERIVLLEDRLTKLERRVEIGF